MSRELHTQDVCKQVDTSLTDEVHTHLEGDALVLAAEDARLTALLPIKNQTQLPGGEQLSLPSNAELHTDPLYRSNVDQDTWLPRNHDERFHFETNTYDSAVTIFHKTGYFQRPAPFMDLTRIVKPSGTITAFTGLQPAQPPDHDAKWWVPDSDDVSLKTIRILRSNDYKTPIVASVFTVTSDTARHADAQIVTRNDYPEES